MDKELLEELCVRYGFQWSVVGQWIKIISKRDTYYILNVDHEWRPIKLYHQNLQNNSGMHEHGKHCSIYCIFKSIKSHDEIYLLGHRHNKFERIIGILNQLYPAHA